MAEWLETLDYGAQCREVESRLWTVREWKTLSVNSALNGYHFSNQGRMRQRKQRDGPRFLYTVSYI